MRNIGEKKVGGAVLYSTRYGSPKGTQIFIHQNYRVNMKDYLLF